MNIIVLKMIFIFTIHFATINTKYEKISKIVSEAFTIHFATINTRLKKLKIN